jgi:hypothetical protein
MVITPEKIERDIARRPEHVPTPTKSRWTWIIVVAAAAILIGLGSWALLQSPGDEALEPDAAPVVTMPEAQHDSGIEQLLREQTSTTPSAHDSGIEQLLRDQTSTTPSAHDSGIEQLLRDQP